MGCDGGSHGGGRGVGASRGRVLLETDTVPANGGQLDAIRVGEPRVERLAESCGPDARRTGSSLPVARVLWRRLSSPSRPSAFSANPAPVPQPRPRRRQPPAPPPQPPASPPQPPAPPRQPPASPRRRSPHPHLPNQRARRRHRPHRSRGPRRRRLHPSRIDRRRGRRRCRLRLSRAGRRRTRGRPPPRQRGRRRVLSGCVSWKGWMPGGPARLRRSMQLCWTPSTCAAVRRGPPTARCLRPTASSASASRHSDCRFRR